jgi:hypothetical protein
VPLRTLAFTLRGMRSQSRLTRNTISQFQINNHPSFLVTIIFSLAWTKSGIIIIMLVKEVSGLDQVRNGRNDENWSNSGELYVCIYVNIHLYVSVCISIYMFFFFCIVLWIKPRTSWLLSTYSTTELYSQPKYIL